MAAMECEFPDQFALVPSGLRNLKAAAKAQPAKVEGMTNPPCTDPKSKLASGLQILLERSITKEDVQYIHEEIGGNSVCTVTIADPPGTFKGKPVPGTAKQNKKQAENNAASVALAKHAAQIKAKTPEHEAKKARKQAEFEAKK